VLSGGKKESARNNALCLLIWQSNSHPSISDFRMLKISFYFQSRSSSVFIQLSPFVVMAALKQWSEKKRSPE